MQLNGSEILIECLKEQGVDTVFGYPGGAILNVYDALYGHPEIHHVLTSHEQGASHAADGYARSTGKVGVCFATSGPGATNLVTGIATAFMDSVPMVAVTCNVTVPLLGKDSFQEVDIAGITTPITKHNFIVKDVTKLADTVRRAFNIAKSGRPGPVLVDITKDVTAAKTDYKAKKAPKIARDTSRLLESDLNRAIDLIAKSKKPVIFTGGGTVLSDASKELAEFVELVDAPVCDTLMGKGGFDGTNKRYMGMLGMHGTKVSNLAVCKCDLLIAVGVRFSDRVLGNPSTFAKDAKILQIDIDPAEINKNVVVDAEVIGDIKEVLTKLNASMNKAQHKAWMKEIAELQKELPLVYETEDDRLTGPAVIESIYKATKGDAIMVTEVGQHQMWAAQYYKYKKPHKFLSSGGLGTMGYGLGAAIGAKTGNPDSIVVNVAGDGCFRMNMNELATAAREKLNLIEVIVDNRVLGMVRQWQDLYYNKHYSATILDDGVDFVKLSEAMGCTAVAVSTKEEFNAAFKKALKAKGPFVIDARIEKDDKVWPMVSPGTSISECFDDKDLNK
ncbi:MAG: biosynthetic-type acetolactate synthase large subunit [Lachnospiraceae bacterium]|nr:biosynthetic-type acetolactate synthase large subunit [Lachnospiraceae bacterium]